MCLCKKKNKSVLKAPLKNMKESKFDILIITTYLSPKSKPEEDSKPYQNYERTTTLANTIEYVDTNPIIKEPQSYLHLTKANKSYLSLSLNIF